MSVSLVRTGADDIAAVRLAAMSPHRAVLTEAVLDRATTGLVGLDAESSIVLCNRSAAEMLGMAAPTLWRPIPIGRLLADSSKLDDTGRLALEKALRDDASQAGCEDLGLGDHLVSIALDNGRMLNVTVSEVAGGHRLATLHVEDAGVR